MTAAEACGPDGRPTLSFGSQELERIHTEHGGTTITLTPEAWPSLVEAIREAARGAAPADRSDQVYRWLHQARENLCSAQTNLPVVSWRAMLGKAVAHIDYVGSRECPMQWSRFDRDDQVPPYDNKGFSEERCTRCGWVMGHPPLNCQNDNTPHVFPSQLAAEAEPVWSLRRIYEVLATPEWNETTRKAATMLLWYVEQSEEQEAAR